MIIVLDVSIEEQTPTTIPSWKLYQWTKFSVGDLTDDHFRYGAIKPPTSQIGWFPTAIGIDTVLVASGRSFESPEEAIDWLRTSG